MFNSWAYLTDVNNLLPEPPKSFRDANALVLKDGAFLGSDGQRELLRKLGSVPSAKVARAVRAALNAPGTAIERIRMVADELDAAGIQPPAKVEPLPEVNENEVRLVVWMAVRGTRGFTGDGM